MEKLKEKLFHFRFRGVIAITIIFALMAISIFVERSGISYNYVNYTMDLLPKEQIVLKVDACAGLEKDTLLIYNSMDADSRGLYEEFEIIFADMKVGYQAIDASETADFPYHEYQKVVVLLSDLGVLGEDIVSLMDYVKNGGNVMFAMTLIKTPYSSVIESMLGIIEATWEMGLVDSIYVEEDFMIGGGRSFVIPDGYDSGRAIQLDASVTKVHAHTGDERKMPLIWEAAYGDGKCIVDNFGIYEKQFRGFYSASYSLMTDVCVYPVINGSTFYLDDFPSQIPSGDNEYIRKDYQTSIRDFYINIWWPDMMNIADKYGLVYTGLAIESYDDHVDGTVEKSYDEEIFLSLGNMLLRKGGEIGYHGYNHQPLCFDNCDYKGLYEYKTWKSYDAMEMAFDNLIELCDHLFPEVPISVYVPPSNILSEEGKQFLMKEYPWIRTISGIYFKDYNLDFVCTQEYDVLENGVVEYPRIVSGCNISEFMYIAIISELNFHFVNNHFTHPDDALDPDRGALHGWENLKIMFEDYLSWMYSSAPMLRNVSGSEMSAAVQRFVAVAPRKEITEDVLTIRLDNFYDEAQLMVRFNDKKPVEVVEGGTLTPITGNLYLLEAKKDTVTIAIEQR